MKYNCLQLFKNVLKVQCKIKIMNNNNNNNNNNDDDDEVFISTLCKNMLVYKITIS